MGETKKEMKTLNGYEIADEKARTDIDVLSKQKVSLPVDTEGNMIEPTEGQVYGYTGGRYNWITPVTSWNQLEDKPFGEESVKESTIPSTYVKVTQAVQSVSGVKTFDIIDGDTYEVYLSDKVYTCVAANGCIGDSLPFYQDRIPDGYEGLPFYIRGGSAQYVYVYGLDIGYVYTFSVNHVYTKIDQLDEKFVPYVPEYDNVFTINAVQVSSSYNSSTNSYTVTPDKTYKEMMEAVAAGKNVQVIVIPDDDPNDVWYFTLGSMYGAQSAYFISISGLSYRVLWWYQDSATSTYTMTLNLGGYIASKEYVDEQAESTLPLIVKITKTTTGGTTTYSVDKTFAEIKEAYDSGRDVILTDGNDTEKVYIPLYAVINDGGELYMFSYTYSNSEFISSVTFMIYEDNGNTVVYNAGSYSQNIPSSSDMAQWNKAQPNQNAFSYVKVDSVKLSANTTTDTLQLVKGANVSFAVDTSKKQIIIAATDTTYSPATTTTDGLMSADDKVKLDGLPIITTSDNGKILQVVDGEWTTTDNICYEKSETLLAWDGNTTGLESVTSEDESVTVYRVSDFIPLANIMGATINVNTGGVTNSAVISDTFITELSDNASYACVGVLISVATAGIEIDGITFSTPGTYCISPSLAEGAYISSIVKSEIKRIDEKFIPDIAPVKLNEITSVSYSKPQTVLLEKNHIYKIVLKASVAVSDHEYTARITFTAPNGAFDKEYTLMSGGSSAKNSIGFNVVIGDDYVLVDDELHTFSGSSKDNLPAITFAQTNSSVTASQDYYKPYVIKLS